MMKGANSSAAYLDGFESILLNGSKDDVCAHLQAWLESSPQQPMPQWIALDVLSDSPSLLESLLPLLTDEFVRLTPLLADGEQSFSMRRFL